MEGEKAALNKWQKPVLKEEKYQISWLFPLHYWINPYVLAHLVDCRLLYPWKSQDVFLDSL